jgi:heat shock protein HtpX
MAGTFYSQIAANRRNSFFLVLIVVMLLAALGFAIGYGTTGEPTAGIGWLGVFGIVAIVSSLASYYSGDKVVLGASKARPVTAAEPPQLINVVTELALAAAIPMPAVYLIDDTAPNAFATGRDPRHASIAITTGLLEKLDREELQGVIGHELSHVRNYDIRYSLLVC